VDIKINGQAARSVNFFVDCHAAPRLFPAQIEYSPRAILRREPSGNGAHIGGSRGPLC
jgi:hypothetical protein